MSELFAGPACILEASLYMIEQRPWFGLGQDGEESAGLPTAVAFSNRAEERAVKILLVEDSERLRRSLERGLSQEGFAVDTAEDGVEGLELAKTYDYEAIVLDLMMPRMSGLEMLQRMRAAGRNAHVLILSAKDQVQDRVRGLELGADDYLVKPFSFEELCARLRALDRRRSGNKNPQISVGGLQIDTSARFASAGGQPLDLTPSEYSILELLAKRPGQVFSKNQLIEHLHRSDTEVSTNLVEVMISALRKKLRQRGLESPIKTRRGHGYLIERETS